MAKHRAPGEPDFGASSRRGLLGLASIRTAKHVGYPTARRAGAHASVGQGIGALIPQADPRYRRGKS